MKVWSIRCTQLNQKSKGTFRIKIRPYWVGSKNYGGRLGNGSNFYGSDWSDPLSQSAKQPPHAYRNSLTKACDLWCNLRNRNQKRKEKCRGILDLPSIWLDFLVFVPLLLIFWFLRLCSWFLLGKFFWGFIWVLKGGNLQWDFWG